LSDETFSLIAILSAIAAAATLWLRFSIARKTRRLMRSLSPEQIESIHRALDPKSDAHQLERKD
jgi:hypothetical protein